MSGKLNIILELRNCCISVVDADVNADYEKIIEYMVKELKKCGTDVYVLKYNKIYRMLFIRPYFKFFLKYLFEKYNVSVWSSYHYTAVKAICDIIFSKEQKKQLKYVLCEKNTAWDNTKWNPGIYDINNKKLLYNFESYKSIVKDTDYLYDVKDLSFLWKNKPYSNIFTKENTILIDISKEHLVFNKYNVLLIKNWLSYDTNDRTLLDVTNYLKTNSNKKSIIDTAKLKHFTKIKKVKKTKKNITK